MPKPNSMDETTFLKCACPHCDDHIEYPGPAAGQTIPCPHCGMPVILPGASKQDQQKRAPLTFVGIVTGGLLVVGLAGALLVHWMASRDPSKNPLVDPRSSHQNQPAKETESRSDANAPKSPGDLKAGMIKLERKAGSSLVYAVGRLKNNSAYQRFGVKIELNLLDSQGQKIGAATDYTQVIEPRDEWSFRALINETKAASAKLDRISEQE